MGYKQITINMPTSKYGIKCPYSMVPECIVVHNTANDASARNEIKYMQSNNKEVSFHFAVDDKEVVQGIPLIRNGWHAGDGGNGKGNRTGIGIEICYSKSGGDRFIEAEKNAAEFIASLLDVYGWSIDKVKKHQDFSGKYCPHRTLDMGWDRFLKMVEGYRKGEEVKPDKPDKYTVNGLTFTRANDFRVVYHDANKRKGGTRYCNGGFFGFFKSEKGENFTLPVANLVCDIAEYSIKSAAEKYVKPYISGGKLRISTDRNQSPQFKGKKVSTLIVPKSGKPYVADVSAPPSDCLYAISGVPTVRHGDDVDYYNYVKAQGWDDSCMYATYRNWVGIRGGEIWIITGRTQTKNYIYGMEFWKKVQSEGFEDIICMDGGSSYYYKDGSAKTTIGSREVNNLVLW